MFLVEIWRNMIESTFLAGRASEQAELTDRCAAVRSARTHCSSRRPWPGTAGPRQCVQRVRFGLDLDGERGWHARDTLGDSTLGPLGFLNVLETQLGLTRAVPAAAAVSTRTAPKSAEVA